MQMKLSISQYTAQCTKTRPQQQKLHALLFTISVQVLLRPLLTITLKMHETGSMVYRPYQRKLEYLRICKCHCKGSMFSSVMLVLVQSET